MSEPLLYRLVDAIRVRRANGIFWTLTFRPILPHSSATVGPPRDLVITVTDARYRRLETHGPNYGRDEIEAMVAPRVNPRSERKRGEGKPAEPSITARGERARVGGRSSFWLRPLPEVAGFRGGS